MEWHDWLVFILLACCISYPDRIQKLEKKVKKLEKKRENNEGQEKKEMSKIIQGLVGKKCEITVDDDGVSDFDDLELNDCLHECRILEADEDWVKVSGKNKKNKEFVHVLRIDDIRLIKEILNEEESENGEEKKIQLTKEK